MWVNNKVVGLEHGLEVEHLPGKRESEFSRPTKKQKQARCWWLTSAILATEEAEIRRIAVQSQPGQTVREQFKASPDKQCVSPYLKNTHHKKSWQRGSR
jgi:hypothetical protein